MDKKSKQTVHVFNKYAVDYDVKYADVSMYEEMLTNFISAVSPTKQTTILDLGCGPGNVIRYVRHQQSAWQFVGIDLSENMIELARTNNPTADFHCMDVRDVAHLNRSFNGVLASFILPYLDLSEVRRLLKEVHNALLPAGVIYMSFIEGDSGQSGWQPKPGSNTDEPEGVFVNFHSKESILKTMRNEGYEICKHWSIDYHQEDRREVYGVVVAKRGE